MTKSSQRKSQKANQKGEGKKVPLQEYIQQTKGQSIARGMAVSKKRGKMSKQEFIDKCANDVGFFAHNILYKQKRSLAPKQIALIEAFKTSPHVAAIFNRQGGKTETLAVYDVHELCFGKQEDGSPVSIYIYAPILSQTEIIMGRIHQFFNSIPMLKGFVKSGKQLKHEIEMKNGNTIKAMSASDHSHVRGHSPTHIQIDESQDISDRVYYDDILPSGAATGAVIQETGTPKGRNHFYNLYRMKDKSVKVVTQTWKECPFIDKDYVLRRKARMPRAKFNAEFNCVFLTEKMVAFSTEMLEAMLVLEPEGELPEMNAFYLGGDIAKHDESVFAILGHNPVDNKLYMVELVRKSAFQSYKVVFDIVVDLCDDYNIVYGLIDMTGVGEGIVDLLPDSLPVEGVFQSNEEKQEMVDEFMKLGEGDVDEGFDPKIFLWNDYDLKQQFYEWEAKKLKSGKYRYHHPDGGHDDIVMAVLAAAKAYVDDNVAVDYGSSKGSNLRSTPSVLGEHDALKILNTGKPDDVL